MTGREPVPLVEMLPDLLAASHGGHVVTHCGTGATDPLCDGWPVCSVACDACNAEPGEPCRFGCLGYAIEHDELAGTEPCS